jgi:hypothetical protein
VAKAYYYVCDNCGSMVDISDEPHPADETWYCDDCDSTALWEFTNPINASLHARRISDKAQANG